MTAKNLAERVKKMYRRWPFNTNVVLIQDCTYSNFFIS